VSADCGVSACRCILLKECSTFVRLLLHHKAGDQSAVHAKVLAASCGFQGLDPLVCCPSPRKSYHDESFPTKPGRMLRFAPPEERWIWSGVSDRRGRHSSSSETFSYHEVETNLHDYWDFKEKRNCPPPVEPEFFDHRFGPGGHHFHYQVEHSEDHSSKRPNPQDKPIIFPGDLRFLRQGSDEDDFEGTPLAPFTSPTFSNLEGPPLAPFTTPSPRETTTTVTSLSAPPTPTPGIQQNLPGCGVSVESRLLGGEQAGPGQYPWLARIGYRNQTSSRISYRCSGSLISRNYIVTAAHCVINLVSDLEISHVRLGDGDAVSQFSIQRVVVHPNYDQPRYSNDIALLRLNSTTGKFFNLLFFSKDVYVTPFLAGAFTPICLPLNVSTTLREGLVGQTGVAAGWSTMNPESEYGANSSSAGVRFIRIPIVNTTSCAIAYASLSQNFQQPIVITPSHLCAQGQPMNDVCRGDSGGPFMDDGSSGLFGNGLHTLIGIVAFGPTLCGVSTVPGVYTLVSSFSEWILQIIRERTDL
ncbi:hypothetical protein KR074_005956, partial [Drosophila pseudoananassae]